MTAQQLELFERLAAGMPVGWRTPSEEGPGDHERRTGHTLGTCESDEGVASIICEKCALYWLIGRRPTQTDRINVAWAQKFHRVTFGER